MIGITHTERRDSPEEVVKLRGRTGEEGETNNYHSAKVSGILRGRNWDASNIGDINLIDVLRIFTAHQNPRLNLEDKVRILNLTHNIAYYGKIRALET